MIRSRAGALAHGAAAQRSTDPVAAASRARAVRNRDILPRVAGGLLRAIGRERERAALLKALWIEAKRYSAANVVSVDVSRVRGIQTVNVHGPATRQCPLVLTALAMLLDCRSVFEFGTFRGDTAWLLAHNLPSARVHTFDLPGPDALRTAKLDLTDPEYFTTWDRGSRFRGTPEAERIVQLFGDSATFDPAPFAGQMDLVYVDASHSYSYVRSDSEAAFRMLSATGTIVWDDYTYYPGIYAFLNELAPTLDRPIHHLLGTRLAVYTRSDLIAGDGPADAPQNWK